MSEQSPQQPDRTRSRIRQPPGSRRKRPAADPGPPPGERLVVGLAAGEQRIGGGNVQRAEELVR